MTLPVDLLLVPAMVAFCTMVPLVIIPMLWLLLFGLEQGKKTTKSWWIATMTAFYLSAGVYEPIQLGTRARRRAADARAQEGEGTARKDAKNLTSCYFRPVLS